MIMAMASCSFVRQLGSERNQRPTIDGAAAAAARLSFLKLATHDE